MLGVWPGLAADGGDRQDREGRGDGPGGAEREDRAGAKGGGHRARGGERDGAEREGADHVVRAHPGQCLGRDEALVHG